MTRQGEPVCDIDSPHKKPYEHLILGRFGGETTDEPRRGNNMAAQQELPSTGLQENESVSVTNVATLQVENNEQSCTTSAASDLREEYRILDHRVMVSVPCSIHSRKPPLSGKRDSL